jgi:hypothetical protein
MPSTGDHSYGDVLTMSPRSHSWSAVYGALMRGRARKIITAETAEGAEMIGVNDLPEQPLRSLRALR